MNFCLLVTVCNKQPCRRRKYVHEDQTTLVCSFKKILAETRKHTCPKHTRYHTHKHIYRNVDRYTHTHTFSEAANSYTHTVVFLWLIGGLAGVEGKLRAGAVGRSCSLRSLWRSEASKETMWRSSRLGPQTHLSFLSSCSLAHPLICFFISPMASLPLSL